MQSYWDRCEALNPDVVPYATTGNYTRDMNRLRQYLGERRINYFGFSYGTFIGETFAAMFPRSYRAMVIDGALDPEIYINRPMSHLRIETAGFEKASGRFLMTCAAHQDFCSFGGDDPWKAYDRLVDQANRSPIPAGGDDPRPVSGDDILFATFGELYSRFAWTELAQALNEAAAGDATLFRQLVDAGYGRRPDGTFEPFNDRYLALSAEQRYPDDLRTYLDACDESWEAFDHFWSNAGCVELYWRALPNDVEGAFFGPFTVKDKASTPAGDRHALRPGDPVRGGEGSGPPHGQRAAAHDERRRPYGVLQRL